VVQAFRGFTVHQLVHLSTTGKTTPPMFLRSCSIELSVPLLPGPQLRLACRIPFLPSSYFRNEGDLDAARMRLWT
jgi:hypothetical protein